MDDIPERVHSMCFWAVGDDGVVDEEMVDIILTHEGVHLRENRRADLTYLLKSFCKFQIGSPSSRAVSDDSYQNLNVLMAKRLQNHP